MKQKQSIRDINSIHRFLDEAGDTTFFGKGKVNILGQNGVSKCFILGLVKFKEPLREIRGNVVELLYGEKTANESKPHKIKNARDCTKRDTPQRHGVGFHAA